MTIRHNEVAQEWASLCAAAYTPSAVSTEPFINSGRPKSDGVAASQTEPTPLGDERGDVSVRGFWHRGNACIFDVSVIDTDAQSYAQMTVDKVIENKEKAKSTKYREMCRQNRMHFTPLIFSVDGMIGPRAEGAIRQLSARLSRKWNQSYSAVCGFVRSRLTLSLVRAMHLCIRGARDPTARATRPSLDSGAGLGLMA